MVLADHLVAQVLQDPGQRITDHRCAKVTDVHLLCDVRPRVVDDYTLWFP